MKLRKNIIIKGIVQGVGFRPFIHKLVSYYHLYGWVLNSDQGVEIDIEGEEIELKKFIVDIQKKLPPLAKIEEMNVVDLRPVNYSEFSIKKSIAKKDDNFVLVSPDISICTDCLKELFNPENRRFRYPFINCTNCGPRFTIIKDIPYDREKTTMHKFKMCPICQKEYENIEDRRYHAQPNACSDCGPEVFLFKGKRKSENIDPIKEAVKLLKKGKIGAIKGLGGFHLACDATNDKAVNRLRELKNREAKPFALMSPDLEKVKKYCLYGKKEESYLIERTRPIVLLKKKNNQPISSFVAPNNNYLGVMLPYTPLHYLLLRDNFLALVMTSGNISEAPIIGDNHEAMNELGNIADFFLLNDRDIFNRCDDSVIKKIDDDMVFFRRSRGYVPYPISLDCKLDEVLALGGELKNTISFSKENYVFPSQYLGDLKSMETLDFLKESINNLKRIFRINPKVIACDLHPDYLSTKLAEEMSAKRGIKIKKVQHHHAHIVSCMAENNISDTVIGVAYDGTGYGDDGNIWGGEFLICDLERYTRVGHLKNISLPGGDKAINEPWRMAYSYLYSIFGKKTGKLGIDFIKRQKRKNDKKLPIIEKMIDQDINSPLTSSCGRLFDAVSSLIGIKDEISYEGQAAMEMEYLCTPGIQESYGFKIEKDVKKYIIDVKNIFFEIISDLEKGTSKGVIASKFHNTVAEFTLNLCMKIREDMNINKIALSGGVFQNKYLTEKAIFLLKDKGFKIFSQRKVPPNDGGISLGQAVIAGSIVR